MGRPLGLILFVLAGCQVDNPAYDSDALAHSSTAVESELPGSSSTWTDLAGSGGEVGTGTGSGDSGTVPGTGPGSDESSTWDETGEETGAGEESADTEGDDAGESTETGEETTGDAETTDGEETTETGEESTSGGDETETVTDTSTGGDSTGDVETETGTGEETTGSDETETGTDEETTGPAEFCGDGIRQGDEQCDGEDFGGEDCWTWGQNGDASGRLTCTDECFIVTTECLEPFPGDAFVHMHACDEHEDCMPVADWPDQTDAEAPERLCFEGRCIQWAVGSAIATADIVQGPGVTCKQVEDFGWDDCPSAPYATCDADLNPEQEVCCYPHTTRCVASNECCGSDRHCYDWKMEGEVGTCFTEDEFKMKYPSVNANAARMP